MKLQKIESQKTNLKHKIQVKREKVINLKICCNEKSCSSICDIKNKIQNAAKCWRRRTTNLSYLSRNGKKSLKI